MIGARGPSGQPSSVCGLQLLPAPAPALSPWPPLGWGEVGFPLDPRLAFVSLAGEVSNPPGKPHGSPAWCGATRLLAAPPPPPSCSAARCLPPPLGCSLPPCGNRRSWEHRFAERLLPWPRGWALGWLPVRQRLWAPGSQPGCFVLIAQSWCRGQADICCAGRPRTPPFLAEAPRLPHREFAPSCRLGGGLSVQRPLPFLAKGWAWALAASLPRP